MGLFVKCIPSLCVCQLFLELGQGKCWYKILIDYALEAVTFIPGYIGLCWDRLYTRSSSFYPGYIGLCWDRLCTRSSSFYTWINRVVWGMGIDYKLETVAFIPG